MKTKKLNVIQVVGIIVITLLLGVFTKTFVLGQLRPAGQYMTGLTVPVSGDLIRSVRGQRVHNFIDRRKTDSNLLTNLNIGATNFCDQDGLNCYTITGLVAGDNLGNHIATQNLQMDSNRISNDGETEGIVIDNYGKVLIGEHGNFPITQLHIKGNKAGSTRGDILAEGEISTVGLPSNGEGTRFMRLPQISSLVAGTVTGTQRDTIGLYSTIFGKNNTIISGAGNSSIAGGESNIISSRYGFIGGGGGNSILPSSIGSVIGGGGFNTGDGTNIVIGGGQYNQVNSDLGFIGGGGYNKIRGVYSSIIGGYLNTIHLSTYSLIGGGRENLITGANTSSVIAGGYNNTINGNHSTIPGGDNNRIIGSHSLAAGHNAQVSSDYTFFWNGDQDPLSTTTKTGTFIIHAPNGVGINVWNPSGFDLFVNGNTRLNNKVFIGTTGNETSLYLSGNIEINDGGIYGATNIELKTNVSLSSCNASNEGSIVYDETTQPGVFKGCRCSNITNTICGRVSLH